MSNLANARASAGTITETTGARQPTPSTQLFAANAPTADPQNNEALRRALRETVEILSRIAARPQLPAEGRLNGGGPRAGRNIIKQRIRTALNAVGSADRRLIAALAKTSVSTAGRALLELQREGHVVGKGTTRDRVFSCRNGV